MFISLIVSINFFFSNELEQISNQDDLIRKILCKKYPFLRPEGFLTWALFPSLFICTQFSFYQNIILYNMASFICLSYFLLMFFFIYGVLCTPEVKSFYDIKQAIKSDGFRSFSTVTKVAHVCKLCFKGGTGLGLGLYAGPKIAYGADYRSTLISSITYLFNGSKTNSEIDSTMARYLTQSYPEDKELITLSDKATIDRSKLHAQVKNRALPVVFKWFV